ncbi:MAG: flotillin family protein [Bacteroidota bacterium]
MDDLLINIGIIGGSIILGVVLVYVILVAVFYRKVTQGKALVRTGMGSTKVAFEGMYVVPLLHTAETMDISLKQVVISREGKDGLICKDNIRADIKVVYFVRVNATTEDVKRVARTIGCKRASDPEMLIQLFEAKFSEALKTVGKQFDFSDLYNARAEFRDNIVNQIGQDLNGYYLDDCAIDYLEQTDVEHLDEENILDAEGIKKIRDLTAKQITLANKIQREKEKEIRKQDVEAQEAILELDKQLVEKEEVQKREIAAVRARELAETRKVQEEESLKAETARIAKERELAIQNENKQRDVIVASKNKERTEAIETEKVVRDKELEATERERIVTLAQIEKEKAVEEEKKNIQDVIRDRVAVEREVVEEQEKIKDTEAIATAEREKKVALTLAEQKAEEELVRKIKGAEADKEAAQLEAEKRMIEANALREAIDKEAEAKKIMADAVAEEHASIGMAEAKVMEAKAEAHQKEGEAQANILEQQAVAEAKGIELKGEAQAEANRKIGRVEAELSIDRGMAEAQVTEAQAIADEKAGLAEAKVIEQKALADAKGVEAKAQAMQKLDGVGKEHEEFKLRLEKDKEVELAQIAIQREIAQAQAQVLSEALKSAKIDIVGGETEFFDRITKAVSQSKYVDKIMENQHVADLKHALLGSNGNGDFQGKLRDFIGQFKLSSDDIRNLTVSALIMKMLSQTKDGEKQGILNQLLSTATTLGIADKKADSLGIL